MKKLSKYGILFLAYEVENRYEKFFEDKKNIKTYP